MHGSLELLVPGFKFRAPGDAKPVDKAADTGSDADLQARGNAHASSALRMASALASSGLTWWTELVEGVAAPTVEPATSLAGFVGDSDTVPVDLERLEALGDCGYQVQSGDTLWAIEEHFGGDGAYWEELYDWNQELVGDDPDLIKPGQVLDICVGAPLIDELDDSVDESDVEAVVEEEPPASFVDVAQDMFIYLAGRDGFLSSEDLDAAMTDPYLTLEQSAALLTMRRLQNGLEEMSNDELFDENDGITYEDLEAYRRVGKLPGKATDRTPDEQFAREKRFMQGYSQELFANGLPDESAIRQGNLGDCYFLAALGSAVAQDPQAVADMVRPESDGSYTVTFPDGRSANVAPPTLAEIASYGDSGTDGMWVTLFERAAGMVRDSDSELPAEELDGGAIAGRDGAEFFSGDGTANADMLAVTADETTRERMAAAFDEGRVVIAGIKKDLFSDNREGLTTAHAYSILAYDPSTDNVTIRNPHGRGEHDGKDGKPLDGVDDGTFTLTMDEFVRLFSIVAYAGEPFCVH